MQQRPHVNLHGKVDLNMTTRLHLGTLHATQGVDGQLTTEETAGAGHPAGAGSNGAFL
jgi:hypothetical protein